MEPKLVLVARTPQIADLVEKCVRKELNFDDLCKQVREMGYKTTSLYEMVIACEQEIK